MALLFLAATVYARLRVPTFGPEPATRGSSNEDLTAGPIEYLTMASAQDAVEIALQFAKQRQESSESSFVVKNQYKSDFNGMTHVYLKQVWQGVEVVNGDMNINVDEFGRVVSYHSSFFNGNEVEQLNLAQMQLTSRNDQRVFRLNADDGVLSPVEAAVKLSQFLRIPMANELTAEHLSELVVSQDGEQSVFADNKDGLPVFQVRGVPFASNEQMLMTPKYLIVTEPEYKLVPVWDVNVDLAGQDNWYSAQLHMQSGNVLQLIDWVHDASYNVYPIGVNDPADGDRELVVNPEDELASPLGWNTQSNSRKGDNGFFRTTVGNNVYAQSNPDGRSGYENNYRPTGDGDNSQDLTFDFPVDLTKEPKTYLDAAVTNLFYWNNMMHDVFYQFGFNEVAGNFQEDNLERGGRGNDGVIANAQDGSGYNNANFATPPDGVKPRMRMYVWTQTRPMHDGDLEAGIIIHEYAHGISTRLTGGPANSNCLGFGEAGGMGEGWGDWFSMLLRMRPSYNSSMDFPMGKYSANRGIRPFDYSTSMKTNPHTYAWISKSGYAGVHAKGSVWATILYEVYWALVEEHGFNPDWYAVTKHENPKTLAGNLIAMQLIVDGMKLQPCRPSFVDARDAILRSDEVAFTGDHVCLLWKAFAKRGLGEHAKAGGKESFDVPEECR